MTHIMRTCWDMNKDELRKVLAERTDLNSCGYEDLVKLIFETIYNSYEFDYKLDLDNITVIDDGDYQGTILFMIPFRTYQPAAHEYILTHIGYGSCSGCDALQAAQEYGDEKLSEGQIADFMSICKDIVCNTIKPYNYGWYEDKLWCRAEEGEK